jgi:hypothetical protein
LAHPSKWANIPPLNHPKLFQTLSELDTNLQFRTKALRIWLLANLLLVMDLYCLESKKIRWVKEVGNKSRLY